MSEFSERLEKHILNNGLTEEYLAKATGFSRSYVARLKNGQRVSPDVDRMTRMFDCLRLTEAEYIELWELYQKELLGTDKYNLNKMVMDFISSFRRVSRIPALMKMSVGIPEVSTVEGREDVEAMIRLLIFEEASREQGHVRMLLQTDCRCVNDTLKQAFRLNPKLRVDHVVCMEPCLEKDGISGMGKYYNIQLLKNVIPVLLCVRTPDYRLYYHYDSVEAHFNSFSMMPFVILTDSCTACIDVAFEHMVIYREKEVCEFYRRRFDNRQEHCRRLIEYVPESGGILSEYNRMSLPEKEMICMGEQPCLGLTGVGDLVQKYVSGELPEELLHAFSQKLESNRTWIEKENGHLVSYFTSRGIARFLQEGRIDEIPEELYRPLEWEDRRKLLEALLEMAEAGSCELHLMSGKKFCYPPGLILTAYDFDRVFLSYNVYQQENCFLLGEGSLSRIFHEFLTGFRESTYVLSPAESIAWLRQCLENQGN